MLTLNHLINVGSYISIAPQLAVAEKARETNDRFHHLYVSFHLHVFMPHELNINYKLRYNAQDRMIYADNCK